MELKHVKWTAYYPELSNDTDDGGIDFCNAGVSDRVSSYGRIGVLLDNDRLEVRQLAGEALPADLLLPVLDNALGIEWRSEAEKLHLGRKNRWAIETRQHRSGAVDYLLRILKDARMEDAPIVAGIHVSMYGKLNRNVAMWLGDVPPLLAAMQRTWPPRDTERFTLEVLEPLSPHREWQPAGQSSGLEVVEQEIKSKKFYVRDNTSERWLDVIRINEDDIRSSGNKKTYEYWDGSKLVELVISDEYGRPVWQCDEDLCAADEIAREIRNDTEATLYSCAADNALIERPLRQPLIGRLYWLPKFVTSINAAYQYIAEVSALRANSNGGTENV